jgi:flavin-dependent dehydrogenase
VVHQPGVWVWVIPFSNGVTSVGFVGHPDFFTASAADPESQLRTIIATEPYFSERFSHARFLFTPRILESWSVTTDKFYGEGFVLTGNVTEFLDPIFSSGVTLATVSSQRAAHLVIRKLNGETIDWETEYMQPVMQGVNTFRNYVEAWYDGTLDTIFFADNPVQAIKNQICSVLAGYVWDQDNPFVKDAESAVGKLAKTIETRDRYNAARKDN